VPDKVLEELHGAFGDPTPSYDFDDPHIDRLLGVGDHAAGEQPAAPNSEDRAPEQPSAVDTAQVPVVPASAQSPAAAPRRRTIVITDGELPDAGYLEEERERVFDVHEANTLARAERDARRADPPDPGAGDADGGPRSTIVIDDLDDGVVIEKLERRTASNIDPRISARRSAVSRAKGRKRLIWIGVGVGVFAVVVLAIALFASKVFDVREVHVQGAVYADQAVIDAVVAEMLGDPVLLVDTRAAEERLEAIPWVERAVVRTDFPHDVYIDIRERRAAVGFQGTDAKFRVIDVTGRVLQVSDGQPADLLLIAGSNPNTAAGAWAPASYRDAAQLVVALPTEIRAAASFVGVDPVTGGLTITINGNVTVRLGNAEDMEQKLARLLSRMRLGLAGVCELDVSTAEVGAVACPAA
jgi:cell division protein FtsQ